MQPNIVCALNSMDQRQVFVTYVNSKHAVSFYERIGHLAVSKKQKTAIFILAGENIFWFIFTGIFHFAARLLGGNGRFKDLMILTGFSKMPLLLINAALFFAAPLLRGVIPTSEFLTILIILSLFGRIWECWLSVLSVSINHNLGKRASIICVVLPEVILVTVYTFVFITLLGR